MSTQRVHADLIWTGGAFEPDRELEIDDEGRIASVGPRSGDPTLALHGRAILPGFVNAHSHAFQRGLRGRGESFPAGAGSFWSWREAMYALVDSLSPDGAYELSRHAFEEMLAAGITSVGEFHYLHHDASGAGYAMDEAVLRAAHDVGIRIVLLNAYYRTGGIGQPLSGGQRRFATASLDEYWSRMEALQGLLADDRQTLGVVAHSIRAVPVEDLRRLHADADRRGMVFHMHLEEQPREIEECVRAYGHPPLAVVAEQIEINPLFTAVHCTHSALADLETLIDAGGNICICPLTEANLGDGIADLPHMHRCSGHVCIGTDSNARLCFTEELRWLEYVQRLARQERGLLVDAEGHNAPWLLDAGTISGARSLGLRTGRIAPGCHADFQVIDLGCPALRGHDPETLLTAYLLGTGNEAITDVCVGGRWMSV